MVSGWTFRMKDDWLRISRGPWRAPARFVVPPSQGTPMRPISTPEGVLRVGQPHEGGNAAEAGHHVSAQRLVESLRHGFDPLDDLDWTRLRD